MNELILHVLSSAFNLQLPFGFSFGMFCVMCWSIPLLPRLIKSLF